MVCPRCGNDMGEGNMYCEVCGKEVVYVPNYEPEIENSIKDVLSTVADEIDPSRVAQLIEDDSDDEYNEDIVDESKELLEKTDDFITISKRQLILILSVLVSIIVILSIIFTLSLSKGNSRDYQLKQANKAIESGEYVEAINFYDKAFHLDESDMSPLYSIADCYISMGNEERAIDTYEMIASDYYDTIAIDKAIEILVINKDYSQISRLLQAYGDEQQMSTYTEYIALPPSYSIEEGAYSDMLYLELSADHEGKIYYTTDGSEPGSDCELYEKPIEMRNGTYIINAIFVNNFGICSDSISKRYDIKTDAPLMPIISLDEGHYDIPQMVTVTVPLGVTVYYTTDGSSPTTSSAIYTAPISIPTGDSWYRFVAVSPTGNLSSEVSRKYILTVDANISKEDAINIVKNKQFEVGRVIDLEGTLEGGLGKYMYSYSDLRYINNRTMYMISEYYQEGTIRMVTGNLFAVDVNDGSMFQAVLLENGDYSLHVFGQ